MSSKKRIGFLAVAIALLLIVGYLIANQGQNESPQAVVSPISSSSPEPKLRTISIVSSGDILLHERLWAQAKADGVDGKWDFYPQLADLEPEINSADLALCHLEAPLAELGVDYQGYPTFNAPHNN